MLKKMMYVGLGLFLFCLVSTQAQAELVSEWKFDGNARDSVGNNHGTLKGNPTWAANRYKEANKAIALDGKDDYVDCGRDKSLSFGNGTKDRPFSIEWWQKSNIAQGEGGKGVHVLKKGHEYFIAWGNAFRIHLFDKSSRDIYIGRATGVGVRKNQWTHIVVTYDGSGSSDGIKFYQDGKFAPSNQEDRGSYTAMGNKNSTFTIGRFCHYFNGLIDDFRIYNHTLSPAEVKARYSITQQVSGEKIKDLEGSFANIRRRVQSFPISHSLREFWEQVVNTELSKSRKKIKSIKDRNFLIPLSEMEKIDKMDLSVQRLNMILTALEKGKLKSKDYLSYVVSPISSVKILPTSVPREISDEVRIIACPGEYEPGSFVITAFSDINSLTVEATDLKGKEGIIPSSNVDIKVVKCWYQAGTAWSAIVQDKSGKVLVPELLLNDDSLVKVDYEKKENYLKLTFPEREKYVWISDPSLPSNASGGCLSVIPSVKEFPVKDSPVLLPVNIPAMTSQQFWVTVKVPGDAKSGIYTGKINLSTLEKPLGALTLKLRVLPFKLLAPYYTFSIDYHGRFDPENPEKGTISSHYKSRSQFKRELENMVAHGLNNCQHYAIIALGNLQRDAIIKKKLLGEVLKIRKEAGMDNKTLYLKGGAIGNPTSPKALDCIKKNVRDIIEFVKPYGTDVVYFYGIDEVKGEKLKSQRLAWKAVREAGGRIFVAGGGDNIKMMGNIQDMHVRAGWPSKEEADKWHSYGHKIFCYGNPQCGVENPVVYRRNFGLLLWKCNYDGAANNAYQHTFGLTWNDFDHPTFRAHNITYPAVDGPIDTIAWEGYREAVDDVRYVTTLQETIEEAGESTGSALLADNYLKDLKTNNRIETENLDIIRKEIINHILSVRSENKKQPEQGESKRQDNRAK